jgi:hypothetical protein
MGGHQRAAALRHGESFTRVHWVAVPAAMRARRLNNRAGLLRSYRCRRCWITKAARRPLQAPTPPAMPRGAGGAVHAAPTHLIHPRPPAAMHAQHSQRGDAHNGWCP